MNSQISDYIPNHVNYAAVTPSRKSSYWVWVAAVKIFSNILFVKLRHYIDVYLYHNPIISTFQIKQISLKCYINMGRRFIANYRTIYQTISSIII